MTFTIKRASALALAALVLAFGLLASGQRAEAAVSKLEGPVLSKNSQKRTFRINAQNRGPIRFRVTQATQFERVSGFSGLRRGRQVEVRARRTSNGWIALKIEPRG